MYYLYSILVILLLPFALLKVFWRGFLDSRYRAGIAERLGSIPVGISQQPVWIHAVSVGEVRAIQPLIQQLLQDYPDTSVHVTTSTPTGREMLHSLFSDTISLSYFPYDAGFLVRRFLAQLQPRLLLVVETEIWPTVFRQCEQQKIPICLLNARLSERSLRQYHYFRGFTHQVLSAVTLITAKSDPDKNRFLSLGMKADKVHVTGNLKFDLQLDLSASNSRPYRQALSCRSPVWIAGSTHAGEEEIVLQVHQRILQKYPQALLVLMPRHPQRWQKIQSLCQRYGFSAARASQLPNQLPECVPDSQVLLGDQLGQLMPLYAEADVAFIGGSLVPHGGHNPLEATVVRKPVISGDAIWNFQDIYALLQQVEACALVATHDELADAVLQLIENNEQRIAMGDAGYTLLLQHRGATTRTMEMISVFLQ